MNQLTTTVRALLCLCWLLPGEGGAWEFPFFGDGEPASSVSPWSYDGNGGPPNWGALAEGFDLCESGLNQSPVDIAFAEPAPLPPLSFQYRSSSLVIENRDHTIRVDYEPGSYLRVGAAKYELKEFHFHTPSEHTFNGRHTDMEIQLVHRDGLGNTAIVAIPVVAGRRHNILVSRILEHLPPTQGTVYSHRGIGIKPVFLLPADRRYFSYVGSLTTPPCTEGVRWLVLQQPLELPFADIQRFEQVMGRNTRPIQKANSRTILASH